VSPRSRIHLAIRSRWLKVLAKYAKDNPEFTFKAGVVEGRVVYGEGHRSARDHAFERRDLFETAVHAERSAQRLVTVMNAAGRDLAVVLNQGVAGEEVQRSISSFFQVSTGES